jgi:DNA-binding beta-propeller fold protein YncE
MNIRKTAYVLMSVVFFAYAVNFLLGNGDTARISKGAVRPEKQTSDKFPPMRQPVRIDSSSEGDLFVSDYMQGYIFTMDEELNITKAFAVSGRPLGVVWGKGKIFVGNDSTRRVEVYNRRGKMLYEFGVAFASPTDIAIDTDSDLVFVVDGPERVVKVFDTSGTFISDIPKAGVPQQILVNPTGIAVDTSRKEVIVSDFGDPPNRIPASIKVYDYEGIFRFLIAGDAVQSAFPFSRPQGLAVNVAGNFFVTDSMMGKVLVFDRNTKQGIKSLGSFGTGPGELKLPLDVVIDPASGDVFVTNNRNGRVEVFRDGGLP